MTTGIAALRQRLAALDPVSPEWPIGAAKALAETEPSLASVGSYLTGLSAGERAALFDGSHETGTHHKWLVLRNHEPRFTLWLHEYLPEADRRQGYAEVAHDHRYDLASVILTGGYVAEELAVRDDDTVDPVSSERFGVGDVMELGADVIHRLTLIDEGTMTLVVEGCPRKHRSTAYYPTAPRIRVFADFTERWASLRHKLEAGS